MAAEAMSAMDVRGALKNGMARLESADVPSAGLAAELLLMHALSCDRTWLYTHPEAPIATEIAQRFLALIDRRAAGEPVQYLTGRQEFRGLEFEVTPAVLIPRPETEHVIEVVLERLRARAAKTRASDRTEAPDNLRIADVGTGSGCIAIALATELPQAEIFATDISRLALDVARRNAARHGVSERVHFMETDLLKGIAHPALDGGDAPPSFDLIVSNPPYIAQSEAASLPREVREHEPHAALFGGAAGMDIYARLVQEAGAALWPGGCLILELGHAAAESVRGMLAAGRCWTGIGVTNDLAGIPRVIAAERC